MDNPASDEFQDGTRARILAAAAALIASGGAEAATTRAVATAASVQAPTIYRLFGDKRGLLEAVAEQAMSTFVAGKAARLPGSDPVADLRQGWDDYVAFGLSNAAIFAQMAVVGAGPSSPAMEAGLDVLRDRVRRVARAGRLRVPEERAVDLIHAAGTGTVLTLLGRPPSDQAQLSQAAREAIMAAILDERSPAAAGPAAMALGLRANLADIAALSPGERLLLEELLQRIAGR
jgi:AcrR family transcriptional regulator